MSNSGNNFFRSLRVTEKAEAGETPQRKKEPEFQTSTVCPPTSELKDLDQFSFSKIAIDKNYTSQLHTLKAAFPSIPTYGL